MWRKRGTISSTLGWAILFVVGICSHAVAQTGQTFGELTGTVVDAQGGVLPGVTVTLSGTGVMGEQSTATNEHGIYRFPAVPPGECKLTFSLSGFAAFVREGLIVAVRRTVTQNVTMEVATLRQTVTVQGGSPVVDVENAKMGERLDAETLALVPTTRSAFGTVTMLPGMVMSRQDVGGLEAANFSGMANHGAEGYNFTFLGVVADSFQGNGAMYYMDYNAAQEISVDTAGMGADIGGGGGANINIVPKSGSNDFKGSAFFTGTGKDLSWSNIDDGVRQQGLTGRPLPLRLFDTQFDAGGHLGRDRVWWYASFRDYINYESIAGFPIEHKSRLRNYTFRGDVHLTTNNRLTAFYAPNYKLLPNRFGAFNVPPESTAYAYSPKHLVNGTLTSVLSENTMLEVGSSMYIQRINLEFSKEWHALGEPIPASQDIGRNVFWGARADGLQLQYNDRLQMRAGLTHYQDGWLGGNHQFKLGTELGYGGTDETREYVGDTRFQYLNGVPSQILAFNTPTVLESAAKVLSGFVQDRITYPRVTLSLGLRYAFYDGELPEQEGGGGRWVPRTTFPKLDPGFNWGNFAPRTSLTFKLTPDGRNLFKATYGQYYDHMFNSHFSLISPNEVPSSGIARYTWFGDLNGNGAVDEGEFNPRPLSVFVPRRNSIDPELKQPRNDEISFTFEREIGPNTGASVSWVQRWYSDNWADVNVGIPLDGYTPISITDSGPDNIANTGDDRTITMYSVKPEFRGQDAFRRQTVPGTTTYKGLELSVNRRLSGKWQMKGSYAWSRHDGVLYASQNLLSGMRSLPNPNDPNRQIDSEKYGRAANDQPHAFKLATSYLAPWGIQLGANLQVLSGLPRDRTIRATLTQGSTTVRAERRGTYREDTLKLLAIKFDKQFRLPAAMNLSVFAEMHNLLNANAGQDYGTLTQSFASQAALDAARAGNATYFGRVTSILAPRIIKLGAKLQF